MRGPRFAASPGELGGRQADAGRNITQVAQAASRCARRPAELPIARAAPGGVRSIATRQPHTSSGARSAGHRPPAPPELVRRSGRCLPRRRAARPLRRRPPRPSDAPVRQAPAPGILSGAAGGAPHQVRDNVDSRDKRHAPRVITRDIPPNLLFFRVFSPAAWHADSSARSGSESGPEAPRFKPRRSRAVCGARCYGTFRPETRDRLLSCRMRALL